MLDVYLTGLILGGLVSIIVTAFCIVDMAVEHFRRRYVRRNSTILAVFIVAVVLWPLIIPAAVLAALFYGLWSGARYIKNGDFNYD